MKPKISAVICTHNRSDYLRKCLNSLVKQSLGSKYYEVIVVDNASTDNTKHITKEFRGIKNIRYIYESKMGISHARNIGFKQAKGKIIAYIDDDAIASTEWLEKILHLFEKNETAGCICGKIEPIWEKQRPKWVHKDMLGKLSIVDWSKKQIVLNKKQWFAGVNMAFPKKVLEDAGGFSTKLGRKGRKLLSMEEVLVKEQIEAKGLKCIYHPELSVKHHITPNSLRKRWFIGRSYWQGISNAVVEIIKNKCSLPKRIVKAASMSLPVFFSPSLLFNLIMPTNNPRKFSTKCESMARIGYCVGMLRNVE